MKKITAAFLAFAVSIGGIGVLADEGDVPSVVQTKAFPTAQGGGMYTLGARGAIENSENMEVYHVTNLNDSGEGSFRDAVSKGNRIVVFDVSGMIDLQSRVSIGHDNVTILGQTAPSDGICFRGNSVKVNGNNIILRYLRFRVGSKLADGSNTETQDGFGIPIGAKNVIMDHCSVSWGTDENLSVIGTENVTVQWSIISEALNSSIHAKGEHSYAGIWGGVNTSFHHNIIASHKSRNPKIGTSETVSMTPNYNDRDTVVDMWNNVIYNWGDKAGYGAENGANVNLVNNYYKAGPATPEGKRARIFELSSGNKYQPKWSGDIYAKGNYIDDNSINPTDALNAAAVNAENWQIEKKTGVYLDESGIQKYNKLDSLRESSYLYNKEIQSANDAYNDVIADAGARLPKMDLVDSRIIDNVVNRTAPEVGSHGSEFLLDDPLDGIPSGQEDLYDDRGYPIWTNEVRLADYDSDADGIADVWEDKMGLDKTNPYDSLNIAPDGYTWLEIFGEDLISPVTSLSTVSLPSDYDGNGNAMLSVNADGAEKAEFYNGSQLLAVSEEANIGGINEGDIVIAASYTDGVLQNIETDVYDSDFVMPSVEGGEQRVFVWNSLEGMKPSESAFISYVSDVTLGEGMNVVCAKLYYSDGTSKITPMTISATNQLPHEDENVLGDFDVVGTLDNISNIVKNGYKGIYADNFAIVCGYNDNFEKVIRYGKLDNESLSEKDDKGYRYIKISVRNGHADLYAAKTLAQWDKLSESGYDYNGTNPKAGSYKITPQNSVYEAVVSWRVITQQTSPTISINNIEDNSRITYNQNINMTVNADGESDISEVAVLFNDEIIKTMTVDASVTIDIPITFTNAVAGELKVMCFDENLCSGEDSVQVYVTDDLTPWQIADIGTSDNDVKMYSATTNDYTYKLNTCEGLIGATSDKFGYMYQKFDRDMRMYSRLRINSGKQVGYVLRNTLSPNSAAYFIGCEMNNGEREYKVMGRTTDGGEMTKLVDLNISGDKAFLIVEKAGDNLNIYETENATTVYTTKTLLYTVENCGLNDTYYMGFGATKTADTTNPSDAGWIALDGFDVEKTHIWNMDYGLDWCWQNQEANVLKPTWTNETIGGNDSGKMKITTDDAYTGERYIFREFTMEDNYVPQMSADVMITGDTPAMNVYLQSDTPYKITFDSDKKIYDCNGVEIGTWDSDGFYNVVMTVDINEETLENTCSLTITSPDGETVVDNILIPSDDNFRTQINTEKKTPVTKAVYFEPVSSLSGTYYVDNVSVAFREVSLDVEKVERKLVWTADSGTETTAQTDDSGFTTTAGMAISAKTKSVDGETFTHRIQMDKGGVSSNAISMDVQKGAKITVYAEQGGSSGTRTLHFDENSTTSGQVVEALSGLEYTATADGTITIYSDAKIYIYGIKTVEFIDRAE